MVFLSVFFFLWKKKRKKKTKKEGSTRRENIQQKWGLPWTAILQLESKVNDSSFTYRMNSRLPARPQWCSWSLAANPISWWFRTRPIQTTPATEIRFSQAQTKASSSSYRMPSLAGWRSSQAEHDHALAACYIPASSPAWAFQGFCVMAHPTSCAVCDACNKHVHLHIHHYDYYYYPSLLDSDATDLEQAEDWKSHGPSCVPDLDTWIMQWRRLDLVEKDDRQHPDNELGTAPGHAQDRHPRLPEWVNPLLLTLEAFQRDISTTNWAHVPLFQPWLD